MSEMCCATCDRFALEPGKRRSGVCFRRWMPNALYDADDLDDAGFVFGAYGRVFPWDRCDEWIEQGTIERLEPYTIGDDQ